jgi:hypothetical protein
VREEVNSTGKEQSVREEILSLPAGGQSEESTNSWQMSNDLIFFDSLWLCSLLLHACQRHSLSNDAV